MILPLLKTYNLTTTRIPCTSSLAMNDANIFTVSDTSEMSVCLSLVMNNANIFIVIDTSEMCRGLKHVSLKRPLQKDIRMHQACACASTLFFSTSVCHVNLSLSPFVSAPSKQILRHQTSRAKREREMQRQETLRSSSSRRENTPENHRGKTIGCVSGLFQFISKYQKRRKLLTFGLSLSASLPLNSL